jgi:hypothetical protein
VPKRYFALKTAMKASMADSKRNRWAYGKIRELCSRAVGETFIVVEVGIAAGGSIAVAARAIIDSPIDSSKALIIGFDLFETPFQTSDEDAIEQAFREKLEAEMCLMERQEVEFLNPMDWMANVRGKLKDVGWGDNLTLIKGDASSTVPEFAEAVERDFRIDVLRISCNWYDPVNASLQHLVPLVRHGGIVFLDGIETWPAFRTAVEAAVPSSMLSRSEKCGDMISFVC